MAEVSNEPKEDTSPEAHGQTHTNGDHQESHYQLPDAQTLQEAGDMLIKDENGKELPLHSLYQNQPGRQLIVFIRHFYCGHCEEYIRYLTKALPPSTLATTTPPTTLTVIGCGNTICIPDYRTRTGCPYQIYTDPDRAIYAKLGMIARLSGDPKPEYLTTSVLSSVASSLKNIVTSGPKGFKGGNYSQNGGEFVVESGELKWVRRMRNSADHTLVKELKVVLGVE